jgi:RNase P subunit RPR2
MPFIGLANINTRPPAETKKKEKKCTTCKDVLPIENFRRRLETRDGRLFECLVCEKKRRDKMREEKRKDKIYSAF